MTAREAIDKLDALKPNQYSEEEKLRWLNAIESMVYTDIIKDYIPNKDENANPEFTMLTEDDMDNELVVPFPYDELYISYLKVKIDEANQETQRYNVSATLFNAQLDNYSKFYCKNHMPAKKFKRHIWG